MAKRKEPFGRPTKYRKEFCQMLIEHMKEGLSFESFGAKVDSSKQTLYDWLEKHQDFIDARRKGESYSRLKWEQLGMDGMTNKIMFFNGNMWQFAMKNKFRDEWKDQSHVEEVSKKKIEITGSVSELSEEDLFKLYKDKIENG